MRCTHAERSNLSYRIGQPSAFLQIRTCSDAVENPSAFARVVLWAVSDEVFGPQQHTRISADESLSAIERRALVADRPSPVDAHFVWSQWTVDEIDQVKALQAQEGMVSEGGVGDDMYYSNLSLL